MEIVHVCNINITTLIQELYCKLAEESYHQYVEEYYGKKCFDFQIYTQLKSYLFLLQTAYVNRTCIGSETEFEISIEKLKDLLQNCPNCKRIVEDVEVTDLNNDWYNSEEYIACLEWQLINNGFIEPLIDICNALSINIEQDTLCKQIAITLSQTQVNCMLIPTINVSSTCRINTINIEQIIQNCNIGNLSIANTFDCHQGILLDISSQVTNNIQSQI